MRQSSQRFVKEYANWKISVLKDMARSFPEKELLCESKAVIIGKMVRDWDKGLIRTDEVMSKIAEF